MKKFLAIILALLMVFSLASLAACGEKVEEKSEPETKTETSEPEKTEEETLDLENSKAYEYVLEKVEAGMEVDIAFDTFDGTWEKAIGIAKHLQEFCDEYGFNYIQADATSDQAKQIEQVENFVTMGTVAAICMTMSDIEAIKDTVEAAEQAGTYIVAYGCTPSYAMGGCAYVDMVDYGTSLATQAIEYADEFYPDAGEGELHVMINSFSLVTDLATANQATLDALAKDKRFKVTYEDGECIGIEEGYNAAETSLTSDGEITFFLCQFANPAIGIDNYLQSQGLDASKYAIFFLDTYSDMQALVDNTKSGVSAIRGTSLGGDEDGGLPQILKAILLEGEYDYHLPTEMIHVNFWDDSTLNF